MNTKTMFDPGDADERQSKLCLNRPLILTLLMKHIIPFLLPIFLYITQRQSHLNQWKIQCHTHCQHQTILILILKPCKSKITYYMSCPWSFLKVYKKFFKKNNKLKNMLMFSCECWPLHHVWLAYSQIEKSVARVTRTWSTKIVQCQTCDCLPVNIKFYNDFFLFCKIYYQVHDIS